MKLAPKGEWHKNLGPMPSSGDLRLYMMMMIMMELCSKHIFINRLNVVFVFDSPISFGHFCMENRRSICNF